MKRYVLCAVSLGVSVAAGRPAFVVPERLYAVPNVTCDVNYAQLFDSYTPNRYVLEALSPVGKCYASAWQFVPKAFCRSFADRRVVYVPTMQALDPIASYYTGRKDGNAMHTRPLGGVQLGDAIFAWLASALEEGKL